MKHVLVAAVALAGLAMPVDPAAGGSADRPMKGSCVAEFTFTGPNVMSLSGSCTFTHLGLTTWSATQTVTPLQSGALQIVNDTDYTAANGATMHGHTVGIGGPTGPSTLAFTGTETYSAGTGRFDGVSGEAAISGGATFLGFVPAPFGVGFWTTDGRIGY